MPLAGSDAEEEAMEEGGASDASESADDDEENVAETLTQLREEEQKDLKRLNIWLL